MLRAGLIALLCSFMGALPLRADFVYTFDAASYTVLVGGTVDVSVSLTYQAPGPDYLADPGLIGAGVGLRYTAGSQVAQVLDPTVGGDITANPGFTGSQTGYGPADDPPFSGPQRVAGLSLDVGLDPAITTNTGSLLLGTFRLTAQAAGTMLLQASRLDLVGGSDWVVVNDEDVAPLDSSIQPGTALLVVTVPEPSTLLLAALGMLGVAGSRLWLRRRPA